MGKPQRSRFIRGRISSRNGCGRGRPAWRVRRGVRLLIVVSTVLVASNSVVAEAATPLPAGPRPSKLATMVCQKKAQAEIGEALGESAVVSDQTWARHLYSCEYRYATGTMVLSIKELSSWSQTLDYFNMLAKKLGKETTFYGLGQGAFQTRDGSMVVRKDWKILLVNSAGLPAQFGSPPTSSGDVAATVADIILGCWSGD